MEGVYTLTYFANYGCVIGIIQGDDDACVELPTEIDAEEARLLLAIKLYEMGRLSLGQAAQLAGYSNPPLWNCWASMARPSLPTHLKSNAQRLNGEAAECL
jgi:hypothetical protein